MGVAARKKKRLRRLNGQYRMIKRKEKRAPKIDTRSEIVKEMWDPKKTLKQNYENIGISYNPSENIMKLQYDLVVKNELGELERNEDGEIVIKDDVEGKMELSKILKVPDPAPKKEDKLGTRERWYWKKLYDKYNDNYKAMARDTKLNYNQYTAKVCSKKTQLYINRYKDKLQFKSSIINPPDKPKKNIEERFS